MYILIEWTKKERVHILMGRREVLCYRKFKNMKYPYFGFLKKVVLLGENSLGVYLFALVKEILIGYTFIYHVRMHQWSNEYFLIRFVHHIILNLSKSDSTQIFRLVSLILGRVVFGWLTDPKIPSKN